MEEQEKRSVLGPFFAGIGLILAFALGVYFLSYYMVPHGMEKFDVAGLVVILVLLWMACVVDIGGSGIGEVLRFFAGLVFLVILGRFVYGSLLPFNSLSATWFFSVIFPAIAGSLLFWIARTILNFLWRTEPAKETLKVIYASWLFIGLLPIVCVLLNLL